jgi:hypothetical protein
VDAWFTLTPEELPTGWGFPRRVQTPEGEALVEDLYAIRPGQMPVSGGEVLYDYDHTRRADPA